MAVRFKLIMNTKENNKGHESLQTQEEFKSKSAKMKN